MTPVRKLTIAGAALIAGGMLIAVGARMDWAAVTFRPPAVQPPGLPRVVLASGRATFGGSQIGGGYLVGLGLLIALVPLGWVVAGPRGRLALGVTGLALAAIVAAGVFALRSDLDDRAARAARPFLTDTRIEMRVQQKAGAAVCLAGAAVAAAASIAGGAAGRSVPKFRMPDRTEGDGGTTP